MKGVFLLSFGKAGYYYAALNLCLSIKHYNKDIPVALCADSNIYKWLFPHELSYFDQIIELKEEDYKSGARFDPAKAKVSIYKYLPFKENLYLDVDAVCLKDIQPVLDHFDTKEGFYFTDVVSSAPMSIDKLTAIQKEIDATKDEDVKTSLKKQYKAINNSIDYMWADQTVIAKHYGLSDNVVFQSIQSSFCYIRKGKEAKKFFAKVKKNYELGFPMDKLSWNWGNAIPDEMVYSATLAQEGMDAKSGIKPIFFGYKINKTLDEVNKDHYFVSLYGGGGKFGSLVKLTYREYTDRLMDKYVKEINKERLAKGQKVQRWIKTPSIMQDKHANG